MFNSIAAAFTKRGRGCVALAGCLLVGAASGEPIDAVPANFKKLLSTSSQCNDDLRLRGGQGLILEIKNVNVLGTTISAAADDQSMPAIIVPPQATVRYKFARFGNEPMSWHLTTGTSSDACIVVLTVWSTWVDGMPSNPKK